MGNILRLFIRREEEDHADYLPISRPQYYGGDQPAAAPKRQIPPVNLAGGPNIVGNLQKSSEVCANEAPSRAQGLAAVPVRSCVAQGPGGARGPCRTAGGSTAEALSRICGCNTKDIDESSAEGLRDAVSYTKANAMLIQVPVLGTTKKFWRLSDKATRISRKLALILKSHHSAGKYLAAPLQVSNVWISSTGSVKLRGVSFTGQRICIERVRDDYRNLSVVLLLLIRTSISGGDVTKLPPDYKEFLMLLKRDTLTMQDEFLIVNNSALLPMKNRTEVFLMLCDKINKCLGRTKAGQAKRKRILSKLPYERDWLDTAVANTQINQWVVNVQNKYERTQYDQLRLNRNVRSHMHDYNDDDIEEILYCEWPELLMEMVNVLHLEGELQGTDIQNKFGY